MLDANPGHELSLRSAGSLNVWNDIVSDAFSGGMVDAKQKEFEAELWRGRVGEIDLLRIRARPSRVERWIHGGPQVESGRILLHLQVEGTSRNIQDRRESVAHVGEAVLCAADRRYSVHFPDPYEMFVVDLPLSAILGRLPDFDLDALTGQKVDTFRSQFLLAFLRTAWSQRECLADDPDWRDCVSRTSMDLALRAIAQSGHAGLPSANSELRKSVLQFIMQNLADPQLRTSSIAGAMGVSARTVQNVFERLATTTSGFILDRRLDIAAEALAGNLRGRTITDLAFDCGFSDSAYFSRCFRSRYGMSPRDYLRAHSGSMPSRIRGN